MRDAGLEEVGQVGPEVVPPLCVGVVASGMWQVGSGIRGRDAVDGGTQRIS